jgi:hypothetical protein
MDGVRLILRLGGGSRGGGRLFSVLKFIVIPSSVEVLCKSPIAEYGSIESLTFESGSHLQRIEESTFSGSGLKSIIFRHPLKYRKSKHVRENQQGIAKSATSDGSVNELMKSVHHLSSPSVFCLPSLFNNFDPRFHFEGIWAVRRVQTWAS